FPPGYTVWFRHGERIRSSSPTADTVVHDIGLGDGVTPSQVDMSRKKGGVGQSSSAATATHIFGHCPLESRVAKLEVIFGHCPVESCLAKLEVEVRRLKDQVLSLVSTPAGTSSKGRKKQRVVKDEQEMN
ncbi:hypothetical protein LINPERHAP2_LOCUS34773, partial [Linum perenne]